MEENSIKKFAAKTNWRRVYLHSIFILIIVTAQTVFKLLYYQKYNFRWSESYGPVSIIFYALTLASIYFTAFVVLRNRPQLKRGTALLIKIAGLIGVFFLYVPFRWIIEQKLEFWILGISNYPQDVTFSFFFHDNLVYAFLILIAGAYVKFMDDWYIHDRIKSTLEKQNLRLELDFLKSQVNPHFLFNTLNNIQSFIVQDEKMRSIELIGRLSEFMRFALYECDEEYIDLDKEISMLADYVELERVRCDDRVKICFEATGDFNDLKIPPLLLMPFVENAFKHGADTQLDKSWINITITLQQQQLHLKVENDFIAPVPGFEVKHGGIGLQNVKKRLQYYFKNKHQLQITAKQKVFEVNLTLQLNPVPSQNYLTPVPNLSIINENN
ncbi:sensor histidine kinase [Mucilaginibacter sp. FT3.2]|uniref:sensor histidine kinase n=1 Tax=Mucilaginibacter sp. FT3.2 TaxID=2723090 RepID=UPI00161DEDCA|nr:histidine kinase [Mucilaginibacter sp. FT3.2]MBB6235028.1 sensor histidine kinase YesM [Mucilaginibacter sp. FT3.2]